MVTRGGRSHKRGLGKLRRDVVAQVSPSKRDKDIFQAGVARRQPGEVALARLQMLQKGREGNVGCSGGRPIPFFVTPEIGSSSPTGKRT